MVNSCPDTHTCVSSSKHAVLHQQVPNNLGFSSTGGRLRHLSLYGTDDAAKVSDFSPTYSTFSRSDSTFVRLHIERVPTAQGPSAARPESCLPLDKAATVACNMATNHDKTHKTHILLSASRCTGILCRVTNHCDGCQVLSNQTRVCDWQESFFFVNVHPHLFEMRLPC